MKPLLFFYQEPQRFLRAAMVINVSPNWVSVAATRFSSSSVSRHARALARAVMEAVHSHAFKKLTSGPCYAMDEKKVRFRGRAAVWDTRSASPLHRTTPGTPLLCFRFAVFAAAFAATKGFSP